MAVLAARRVAEEAPRCGALGGRRRCRQPGRRRPAKNSTPEGGISDNSRAEGELPLLPSLLLYGAVDRYQTNEKRPSVCLVAVGCCFLSCGYYYCFRSCGGAPGAAARHAALRTAGGRHQQSPLIPPPHAHHHHHISINIIQYLRPLLDAHEEAGRTAQQPVLAGRLLRRCAGRHS